MVRDERGVVAPVFVIVRESQDEEGFAQDVLDARGRFDRFVEPRFLEMLVDRGPPGIAFPEQAAHKETAEHHAVTSTAATECIGSEAGREDTLTCSSADNVDEEQKERGAGDEKSDRFPARHFEAASGDGIERDDRGAFAEGTFEIDEDAVRAEIHNPKFRGEEVGLAFDRNSEVRRRRAFAAGVPAHREDGNLLRGTIMDADLDLRAARHNRWRLKKNTELIRSGVTFVKDSLITHVRAGGDRAAEQEKKTDQERSHRWTFDIQFPTARAMRDFTIASARAIIKPLTTSGSPWGFQKLALY